jgi:hypothetical protein
MKSAASTSLHASSSVSNFSDAGSEDLTLTDVSDTSSDDGRRRSVTFGPIQIREYERIVGDHPDTRVGVPLSIGWAFYERKPISIDRHEEDRANRERLVGKRNLRMTSVTRRNILLNVFGIPEEELQRAEKEVQRVKKQRIQSSNQSTARVGGSGKSDGALKSIGRKVRRGSWTLLKGMAAAAQSGLMVSPGASMASY